MLDVVRRERVRRHFADLAEVALAVLLADRMVRQVEGQLLVLRAAQHDPAGDEHEGLERRISLGEMPQLGALHAAEGALVDECHRRLARFQGGDDVRRVRRNPADVAGFRDVGQELPARLHVELVAPSGLGERDDLEVRVQGGVRPQDLALELRVEQVVDVVDLDRAVLRHVGEEDAAGAARNGLPVAVRVLGDEAFGRVCKVRVVLQGDRLRPSLLDHPHEHRAPDVDQVVGRIGPGGLDLRQDRCGPAHPPFPRRYTAACSRVRYPRDTSRSISSPGRSSGRP